MQAKNVKLYGAEWCYYTRTQLEMFGPAASKVPYVECGGRGKPTNPECKKADIQGMPTWVINGQKHPGTSA